MTLIAVLILVACAPVRLKADRKLLAAQESREQMLAAQPDWSLKGRLVVSDGEDGGSGSLDWRQGRGGYDFLVRAPITGRSFELTGGPGGAELRGVGDQPLYAADAASLLQRALGWHVPVAALRAWVRGARAGKRAQLVFDADGLPAVLREDGWTVRYRDWFNERRPPLPRRIYAERDRYRVKLLIENWAPADGKR